MTAELMEAYNEFEVPETRDSEPWQIADDSAADWACRRIASAQGRIAEAEAFVQAEQERLERFLESVKAEQQPKIDFFTMKLHPYFMGLRESGALGKKKSYALPHGTLAVRASQPKFARNDAALTVWAKATDADTLVKVEEKPVWAEIKKRLQPAEERPGAAVVDTQTGEVVPGVTVVEMAGETFSVKAEVG